MKILSTRLFLILSLTIMLISCKKDNELSKSVYIPDPENNGLPAYSEWGYNTFGAYIDRCIFVSNDYVVPVKVIVTEGNTSIRLQGDQGACSDSDISLTFKLMGFSPESYTDFSIFNDSTINLTNENVEVYINESSAEKKVQVISGELTFKRIQQLYVDEELVEIIASGVFDVKGLIENEPKYIFEGRFDLGIGNDNFYRY